METSSDVRDEILNLKTNPLAESSKNLNFNIKSKLYIKQIHYLKQNTELPKKPTQNQI